MKAVGNNVVVRAVKRRAETRGGITIPDVAQILTQEGVVVSVGSGFVDSDGDRHPITDVQVGDRVLYVRRSGQLSKVAGHEVRTLPYPDVVAVVDVNDKFKLCDECNGRGIIGEDDVVECKE